MIEIIEVGKEMWREVGKVEYKDRGWDGGREMEWDKYRY